ncbi:MAG: glutamine--tRNA ligase/YqeY domain fusion protein [Candidatus Delongbacteria bacterium]|jgi:glutaminyl-tRNA synthetase|nr:glutamine--tRNA ligase/YqeY domain fusion protein [Candidatus Delongbacteria bacterium]
MKEETSRSNFIKTFIDEDLKNGRCEKVHTRFPPEPSGYLHIGHAKAIVISYGIAEEYNGLYNLRFDDTNPLKEEKEFELGIIRDIKWLGYDWEDRLYYASDYFPILYDFAIKLINKGKAYVCDLNADEMKEFRGTLTEPGKDSPNRERTIEENLELFEKMKNGEFPEGSRVLRAKIDMSSPNMNMRDPVMYRILYKEHHRTGNKWCIYPSYDFTHGQSDSLEGVSHSLCDLSFENHRPLYDWFITELDIFHSRQIEFSRLNLTNTVTSKRKLKELVDNGIVSGWDDPRLPTLIGLRRRGVPAEAIREFVSEIGTSKKEGVIDITTLEYYIRENLKKTSSHVMAVIDPVKLVINNYPEDEIEIFNLEKLPNSENTETREVKFTKSLYVERDDIKIEPESKFFRLSPGNYVKLRKSYIVKCTEIIKNENDEIEVVYCDLVPDSQKSMKVNDKKVKGIIHWVSADHSVDAEVRIYDRLFTKENPLEDKNIDFKEYVNLDSMTIVKNCKIEDSISKAEIEDRFQFERVGYFSVDMKDSSTANLVFNKTISLR